VRVSIKNKFLLSLFLIFSISSLVIVTACDDAASFVADSASAIKDTLAFDDAIAEALVFYEQHHYNTVIIVTGDHECGGMTISFAGTRYFTCMEDMSYDLFDTLYAGDLSGYAMLAELYDEIEAAFGLGMNKNGDIHALHSHGHACHQHPQHSVCFSRNHAHPGGKFRPGHCSALHRLYWRAHFHPRQRRKTIMTMQWYYC
jgi:hypothetical protein